jgi:hypothetical protein
MVKLDLPYLWAPMGRQRRRYWFYRRNGRRIPIISPDGRRLKRGEPGFFEAYERIHQSFAVAPSAGRESAAWRTFRDAPEFTTLKPKTQRDYLDMLKAQHGHRRIATMPREAVFKLRDQFQATPRTANYVVSVLRLILNFAEDRKQTFHLAAHWSNPARRPKKLKTGRGHRPWEEVEREAYRKRWSIGTLERVLFEMFDGTGQRSIRGSQGIRMSWCSRRRPAGR